MNRNLLIGVSVAVIILLAVGGGLVLTQNKKSSPSDQIAPETTNTTSGESQGTSSSGYNDGTYTAQGSYQYHSGTESIKVTLTLKDGVIEAVDVVSLAKADTSKFMQGQFISGYKPMVVGKNIDDVNITRVSGSSLTPIGFKAALEDIKSQASS